MESTTHSPLLGFIGIAAFLLVGGGLLLLVLKGMSGASTTSPEDLLRARRRHVHVFFLLFGLLVLAAEWALAQPGESGQTALAVIGMLFAVPLLLFVGPIAVRDSLVLRDGVVLILWIAAGVIVLEVLVEEALGRSASAGVAVAAALAIVLVAARGLIRQRNSGPGAARG